MKFSYGSKRAMFIILFTAAVPATLTGGLFLLHTSPLTEPQTYGVALLLSLSTLFVLLWATSMKANAKYVRSLSDAHMENAKLWRLVHTDIVEKMNPPDIPDFTPSPPRDFSV